MKLGSLPAGAADPAHRRERGDLRRRRRSSRTSSRCRPTRCSGSTRSSQTIKDIHDGRAARRGASSELGVFAHAPTTCSPTSSSSSSHDVHPADAARRQYPKRLLTGSSIETADRRPHRPCPGATDIAPTRRRREGRVRRRAAPTSRRPTVADGRQGVQHRVPHRRRRRSRSGRRSCARSATTRDAARGHPGDAVGPRGRRRRPARQPRGEPRPAHLPGDPVRLPVPRRAAALGRSGRCCRWCRC